MYRKARSAVDQSSVTEQEQGWDAANIVLGSEFLMPFGIELVGANGGAYRVRVRINGPLELATIAFSNLGRSSFDLGKFLKFGQNVIVMLREVADHTRIAE